MVQCKKCKLFLSTDKGEVIRCRGPCEGVYHKKCVNIKQFQQHNEMCEGCFKHEGAALTDVNSKLEIMYQLQKQVQDLTDAVDFYAEKYQELVIFKEAAEKKINALENKNINLQKQNEALEERVVQLELKEVEKNIEIIGLEEEKEEKIEEVVKTRHSKF